MKVSEKIISYLEANRSATGNELVNLLGITRQALNKHIRKLILAGLIEKEGVTKGTRYRLASGKSPRHRLTFKRRYPLAGLEEHRVFHQAELKLNLRRELPSNVREIVQYAFTELLNNAIEHSESEFCNVSVSLDPFQCSFSIRDYGIGIFYSIYQKNRLDDETAAVGELMKGKMTTAPDRHTGEGVFFTSKCGDRVFFDSHRLKLIFDNQNEDIFLQEKRYVKGTQVLFVISRRSRRQLTNIFNTYAPEDFGYRFERTRVTVTLFEREYLSRSEARRLLTGMEKFREVILDFKGVKTLGRGFVDEIFRVYKQVHPEVKISIINLSTTLQAMINAVVDN
jgi:biotin operon repressor/anti-sigma regulatory factor (Ser/Thr protein kinase)